MMRSIKSLPISQLLALSYLLVVTGADGKVVVGTTRNEESNGTVSVVDIHDHNKTQYYNSNFEEGNYNYGYDISPSGPNGQFHHENKAADGVVYGCYGYLDPNNQAQITFYVSDAWGYRPVRQEQPVEVFFPAQNPEGTTDMKGDTIQWAELIFPEKCTYFAQQVAVAASSNVGQTLVGTSFPLSPVNPPFTVPVNKRPFIPIGSALTTPIAITPLGGTGNTRPVKEQLRIPNPSIRTPTNAIRTPSPTIQTPFATIRNPTPAFIPFTVASSGPSDTGSGTRNPAENGTQLLSTTPTTLPVLTSTTVFNGNQGFGQNAKFNNHGNGGLGGFGNNGNGGLGNNGNGGLGNNGNGGFGNNGNGGLGNNGNGGLGNNGNGGLGNNGNGGLGNNGNGGLGNGFSPSGSPPIHSIGFGEVGTGVFIENPGTPSPASPDSRRPGGLVTLPGSGAFGGGQISESPLNTPNGGRVTLPASGLGSTNTDGNKIGNDFGSSKFTSNVVSVTPSGVFGNTGQPQTTNLRKPNDNNNGGGPPRGVANTFYTEGSSTGIYPDSNHLSTGGPGSQPSSSNNVGETLEQEVEGSSSAILPGRKQPSTVNKSGALKNNLNGGSSSFNAPSGDNRPLSSQAPTYVGTSQISTRQPSDSKGNSGQPSRNGNSRPQTGFAVTRPIDTGISNNSGSFTVQPSGQRINEQSNTGAPIGFSAIPNLPSSPSSEEFSDIFKNTSPYKDDSSGSCPQICSSCSANNKPISAEEIDYSQIPGAVVANVPVIFYPDCSTNAFSRPAVVPFCPSKQQASCSNQQPLTMKFPSVSSYNGNSNVPVARSARTNRRVIRKTRHSHTDNI